MNVPLRQLTLFDAVCLIVGIIVGAGIYECAPQVAGAVTTAWGIMGLWALGGLLSLLGAMCYAELAAAYPRAGGDYVYLTRAYGPCAGYLFGWAQLSVVRPGDIAALALIFAHHAAQLASPVLPSYPGWDWIRMLAVITIIGLTIINMLGVRQSKWTQNLLTAAKVAGIVFVVVLAFSLAPGQPPVEPATPTAPITLAVILVLFTYGGWNEMAYLAAEIRQPERNIQRGLLIGGLTVTAIYLLMNAAFLHALGLEGLARTKAVAQDSVALRLPTWGGPIINALICVSTLGAVNGLVFTGARISYALGVDYPLFHHLGRWNTDWGTPVRALFVQGLLATLLVLLLGSFLETLVYSAAAVYAFYTATCLSVIVLRWREPATPRPYRVIGYPLSPLLFAAVAGFLMHSALTYRPWNALAMLGILGLGLVLYALQIPVLRVRRAEAPPPASPPRAPAESD